MDNQENKAVPEQSKKKKGKRYLFNKAAMFCNHIAVVSLLFSYMAAHVNPQNFWLFSFFGLAYPIVAIINIFFIVYWGIQIKKKAFYSLLMLIAGFSTAQHYLQFTFGHKPNKPNHLIKIMSYNVKVFDLYNWSHNVETKNKIFNLIINESPDIACFQEYFHRDSTKFANTDSILKNIKFKYYHIEYTSNGRANQHFGIATFTNYPIIHKGTVDFGYKSNNVCIYTDMILDKDTVRVFNMHLQSIAFSKEDYKYAEDLQKDVDNEDAERSKNILRRLKRAFIKRATQADLIHDAIASSPYPVIVCGDFNDTPASYAYHTISTNLNDAFVESGNGFGKSYTGIFPSFRIDYILHDEQFKAYHFRTIHEELSDHFPVVCYLEKL